MTDTNMFIKKYSTNTPQLFRGEYVSENCENCCRQNKDSEFIRKETKITLSTLYAEILASKRFHIF